MASHAIRLAIETALTLGLVFGLRLRQTEGLLASVLTLMRLDLAVPDHTTLSRRARAWRLVDRRAGRKIPTKEAVHVLIDSTGLEVYGAGQWLEEKHGAKSRRAWRKLHLALDADNGEIIAHVMTDQDAGDDASQVEPLLDQIDGPIGQFTADGAYDGEPTYDTVTNHSADAAVVIPPRSNAISHGCRDRQPARPAYRGDQQRRADEVASSDRLWQAVARRNCYRPLQVDHRTPASGTILRRAADGSCHWLRHTQSHACVCTPEIRPVQDSYGIATASKIEIQSNRDPCTKADQHAAVYRIAVEAAQAADIAKRVGPHTPRHSFATHPLEDGTDIRIIQVLLGHAKLNNTALYAKVATRTVRAVTSPLDKLGLFKPEEASPDG